MASFSGLGGYVTIDTYDPSAGGDLCIQSWTVNFNVTVEEYPCLNDATGYKQQLVSVDYTSTGTIECSYDSEGGLDIEDLVGSQADIVLYVGTASGIAYEGSGTITSASTSISGARNTATINFTSNAAWTEVPPPP